jgi:hypothetical protein
VRTGLGALSGNRCGGSLSLGASGLFGAERLDARGLVPGLFCRDRFLLSRVGSCGFGGRSCGCSLLLGGGLHVGRLSASADGFASSGRRNGLRHRLRSGRRSASPRGGRGRGLLLGAGALLTLPTRADASDLVVGEHTHVAANGNVHLAKKRDDFFGGHCEFVRQLTD